MYLVRQAVYITSAYVCRDRNVPWFKRQSTVRFAIVSVRASTQGKQNVYILLIVER